MLRVAVQHSTAWFMHQIGALLHTAPHTGHTMCYTRMSCVVCVHFLRACFHAEIRSISSHGRNRAQKKLDFRLAPWHHWNRRSNSLLFQECSPCLTLLPVPLLNASAFNMECGMFAKWVTPTSLMLMTRTTSEQWLASCPVTGSRCNSLRLNVS